jgi:hypothetical protein
VNILSNEKLRGLTVHQLLGLWHKAEADLRKINEQINKLFDSLTDKSEKESLKASLLDLIEHRSALDDYIERIIHVVSRRVA